MKEKERGENETEKKRREKKSSNLGVINIVLRVQMAFQLKSTNATRIGINRHLKWRLI